MNARSRPTRVVVAAAAMIFTGAAFAQSSALTAPNNSAGTPLDAPPMVTRPATGMDLPTRTESAITAFDKLDTRGQGYLTHADVAALPGSMDFDEADRNRDGRLNNDEFQRFWGNYQGAGQ